MDAVSTAEFTLGDLLDDETLGLRLLVGGTEARARLIEGAHSIEQPDPAPWLADGWVMLTTGIALPEGEAEQRKLIRDLDNRGVAALGFGVGCSYDDVPTALVEEAGSRSFPLFVIPLPTPFMEIVAAARRKVASGDAQNFGRLTAIQRYLMSALCEPDPESCIVERLGELVQADVAVVDRKGVVLLGHTPLRQEQLHAATMTTGRHAQHLEHDGFSGWVLPLGDHDGDGRLRARLGGRWLVVGATGPSREHPLLKGAAQLVVPLLEATARLAESRVHQERALRRATLDVLLDARGEQDAVLAAARAEACGVQVAEGVRVAVVGTRIGVDFGSEALVAAVEARVRAEGCTWLTTHRDDAAVVLIPAEVTDDEVLAVLLEVHPHALVGIGRTVRRPEGVGASRLDGALVVRQLTRRGPGRAASYDDLDLGSALIGEIEPDRIRGKVERWLTPVLENPMAYETLVAYLEHDLDVGRTSRALKLHPNSARYRLARIEELLGAPLRRPSTIAALHFALLSQQYTEEHSVSAVAEPLLAA
jgi:purine catabolism regulator